MYHWYTYFSTNYVFDETLTAGVINGLARTYEGIVQKDFEDLNVDGQARRSGKKLGCFVKFMEDNRDVNWNQHFRCNEMTDDQTYKSAELIAFPTDKVSGTANQISLVQQYGWGCYKSLIQTEKW
jgi:hypothetical protein